MDKNSNTSNFKVLTNEEKAAILGGSQPDYNFGYGFGHAINRTVHKINKYLSRPSC